MRRLDFDIKGTFGQLGRWQGFEDEGEEATIASFKN